jgi:hypothetical protein
MAASLATRFQRTKTMKKRKSCIMQKDVHGAWCYKNLIARKEGGKGATRHRVEHISRRKQLMINLYRNNKQIFFRN